MSKTVLLTGVGGFIASHCARILLEQGHEVIGIDSLEGGFMENVPNGVCFYRGDLQNHELVDAIFQHHSPHYVLHLAAYAAEGLSPHIRRYNYQNNLLSSVNLINAAINHGVDGFVFTSSMAVYGAQALPFVESMRPSPVDPYGVAKFAVEQDLHCAGEAHGLRWCIIRPYSVYGENQHIGDFFRNVVGIHMNQCLMGQSRTIFGDGTQRRAFSYISEVAPVICETIARNDVWGQTFNVGGSVHYSINELSLRISEAMSVEHDVTHLPPRLEVKNAWCDNAKTKEYFPHLFRPVPLSEGLERMAEWAKRKGAQKSKPFARIEVQRNLHPKWQAFQAS